MRVEGKEKVMYSNMTGTIVLSSESSSQLRQNIFSPSKEYISSMDSFFEKLASIMCIRRQGSNVNVEFKDLDTSNLDLIINKEIESAKVLAEISEYVSEIATVSFENISKSMIQKLIKLNNFKDYDTDYICKKSEENLEIKEDILIEAA